MTRQTTQSTAEQARALRDVVRINAQLATNAEKVARASEQQSQAAADVAKAALAMRTSTQQVTQATAEQAKESPLRSTRSRRRWPLPPSAP